MRPFASIALLVATLLFAANLQQASDMSAEDLAQKGSQLIQESKWAEAQEVFLKLTKAEPENVQHWASLGLVYRNQDKDDMAIAAYERALNLNPTGLTALAGLAITLEKKGKVDRAFVILSQAIDNGLSSQGLTQNPVFEGFRKHQQFAAVLATAERKSNPCLYAEPYDDFDFWVGDWDVHIGGKKRAENLITKEMNGCIIRERYHNQFGYEGESINYYDPETKKWKQNWVDRTGGIVRYTGGLESEGMMAMEGANTSADGKTQLARVSWTLLPDGTVHHLIKQSADGGKTWQTYFDGIYVKSDRPAATQSKE